MRICKWTFRDAILKDELIPKISDVTASRCKRHTKLMIVDWLLEDSGSWSSWFSSIAMILLRRRVKLTRLLDAEEIESRDLRSPASTLSRRRETSIRYNDVIWIMKIRWDWEEETANWYLFQFNYKITNKSTNIWLLSNKLKLQDAKSFW